MNTWLLIAVVAVIAVIVKRFLGEPLSARDLAIPPLILVGLGIHQLSGVGHLSGVDVTWLVTASLVGLGFGAIRGLTVRLYAKNGVIWQRYSPWTVIVWIVSFAASAGLGLLAESAGVRTEARPLTLSIGVSLLGELATLGARALRVGVPFAPDRR